MSGRMGSWSCQFIFHGDDRPDALEERIIAALETEGLDFDPMTVSIERIGDVDDDPGPEVSA